MSATAGTSTVPPTANSITAAPPGQRTAVLVSQLEKKKDGLPVWVWIVIVIIIIILIVVAISRNNNKTIVV